MDASKFYLKCQNKVEVNHKSCLIFLFIVLLTFNYENYQNLNDEDVCRTDNFLDRLENFSSSSYYYGLKDKQ